MSPSSAGRSTLTRPRPFTPNSPKQHRTPTVFLLIVLSLVIQCLLFRTSERLKRNGFSPDRIAHGSLDVLKATNWKVGPRDDGIGVGRDERWLGMETLDYGEGDDNQDSGTLLGIDYTKIYESASKAAKPFVFFGFTIWAAFLFATIGITASDFFCPNLATVADRLGMGESTAGVTFLAFGNGSPDVFSTFSALRSNTFSLAIGELLGASTFIISIVVGSMSLIQPFEVPRWPFIRDVGFFTLAVCVLVGCLLDGNLTILESGGLVGMYVVYVGVVVIGNWWLRRRRRLRRKGKGEGLVEEVEEEEEEEDEEEEDEEEEEEEEEEVLRSAEDRPPSSTTALSSNQGYLVPPLESTGETSNRSRSPSVSSTISGHTLKPRPFLTRRRSRQSSISVSRGSRGSTPYLYPSRQPSDGPRPAFSLLGAVEFRDVINSLRRESEIHGGDLTLPSPMVVTGPSTPLEQTPYDDGMSIEAANTAAGYFGQHNPFSRGHYHPHSPTHHGQRHSVGSMAGWTAPSPALGSQQRRSVSQAPSPLKQGLGVGIRSLSTHVIGDRLPRPTRDVGDADRQTSMSSGSSRKISGLRMSRSFEELATESAGVPVIEESDEDAVGGTLSGWGHVEHLAGSDSTEQREGERERYSKGITLPLETPSGGPNPWEYTSSEGGVQTGSEFPAQVKLSVTIPPDINARTHQTIPSISVIDANEESNMLLDKRTPTRIGKRQRVRLIFHKTIHLLFPSMHGFRHKSWIGRVLAVFAIPAIFSLTITLPVVDDAAEGTTLNSGGLFLSEEDEMTGSDELLQEEAEFTNREDAEERDIKHITARAGNALHHLVDEGGFPTPHSPSEHTNPFDHIDHRKIGTPLEENDGSQQDGAECSGSDVSDEEEEFLFNKYLTAVQCILGPAFCSAVIFSEQDWFMWELMGTLVAGSIAAGITLRRGKHGHHPIWRMVRCFMGFFSAMVWIAAIADEVVQVLQCFGQILGLSDAIIGLTIFAVGNSLADWVANLTVATFAPTMSYAACFGGPMLNILLGVGGAGTYVIASTGRPYPVHVSPTLWVSAFGLVILLLITLCFVPYNGFLISRRWGWFLIAFYCTLTVVNIIFEIRHGRV